MNFRAKQIVLAFAISACLMPGISDAQSVQEGLNYLTNDQYTQAKETFQKLVTQSPSADNCYYQGYFFLKQDHPDIEGATQSFNKGLELDPKSALNKVGLATIKLYKKDKMGADAEFDAIAKATKYKNPDVLYRIAEAYILFKKQPQSIDTNKSIEYSEKLLNLVKNKDKAEYYINLGNAYYEKLDAGKAITNYGKAIEIGDNNSKALAYVLTGNIWGRAKKPDLAKENFNKALAINSNLAIAYKYLSDFYIRNYEYNLGATNLQKYIELTGNKEGNVQYDLATIAFYGKDYDKTNSILDNSWNQISNPLKYKLKALVLMEKSDFINALDNMNQYLQQIPENQKEGSDYGVLGKIQASLLASKEGEEKTNLTKLAVANLTKAQLEGDKTYDYQKLLLDISPSSSNNSSTITSAKIEELKKATIANPSDTKAWYQLAIEQYSEKDYLGSIASWDKLIELIPGWETSYAGKGMALYANDTDDTSGLVTQMYQKYLSLVEPKQQYSESEKAYLAIIYSFFAYKNFHEGDKQKTEEYITKVLEIDPQNQDVLNLQKQIL